MITKLPPWAFAAAFCLALGAGIINVVGLLGIEHQVVSHLTGTTSLLGAALAAGSLSDILRFAGLIAAFVGGCIVSALIVQDSTLQLGRHYGVVLLLQAACLVGAAILMQRGNAIGIYVLAATCGLQNAMVTTFSGSVVRTTHVSGMFTDLGIYLGHRLRGISADARRLKLSLLVIGGFAGGGMVGAWAFARLGNYALLIPAGSSAALALLYAAMLAARTRGSSVSEPRQ